MPEHPEFVAAIYEQTDDDLPRLVYADWLEEHGEPERAELIRLQCKMARGEPYSMAEDDRAFDLVEKHRAAWTAHLPQADGATWEFRRGFPEELAIEVGLLLDQWPTWATLAGVRVLALDGVTGSLLNAFATRTWSRAWAELHLHEEVKPWLHSFPYDLAPGVQAMVMKPQMRQVRQLVFGPWFTLNDAAVTALCESPHLDGLAGLEVPREYANHPRLLRRFGPRLHSWP